MKIVTAMVLSLSICLNAHSESTIFIFKKTQTYEFVENGKTILTGRVSTGKKGYATPDGVFTISTKINKAYSNKYDSWMRNAMFFRGLKYAIHAGRVYNYPASHGCVRVSLEDSIKLFRITHQGTKVVIK